MNHNHWAFRRLACLIILLSTPCHFAPTREKHCECSWCDSHGQQEPYLFGGFKYPKTPHQSEIDETPPDPAHGPVPPIGDSHVRNTTNIHVLISAFRDPRCGQSVFNLFRRAQFPDRISVGIVDQTLTGKDEFDCVSTYCSLVQRQNGPGPCPHLDRITIVRADSNSAHGPIWARAIGSTLVEPEHEFCMQVDAHVDFQRDYDVSLMKMWALTENEYGVLSTYVGNLVRDLNVDGEVTVGMPHYEIPVLCEYVTGGHNVRRNKGADGTKCLQRPILTRGWAAGWSFHKCHMERNVPNDPALSGFFDGEEFSRYLRMWTHGYDVYTPHRPVVFHDYRHGLDWQIGRESTWSAGDTIQTAIKRYGALVGRSGAPSDMQSYGVGKQRTLQQLHAFTGMNPDTGALDTDPPVDCGRLKYVPFVHDPTKVDGQLPVYYDGEQQVPGSRAAGTEQHADRQVKTSEKYLNIAYDMRKMLGTKGPEIRHSQQMREFGEPKPQFWSSLIQSVRSQAQERRRPESRGRADASMPAEGRVPPPAEMLQETTSTPNGISQAAAELRIKDRARNHAPLHAQQQFKAVPDVELDVDGTAPLGQIEAEKEASTLDRIHIGIFSSVWGVLLLGFALKKYRDHLARTAKAS